MSVVPDYFPLQTQLANVFQGNSPQIPLSKKTIPKRRHKSLLHIRETLSCHLPVILWQDGLETVLDCVKKFMKIANQSDFDLQQRLIL